MVKIKKSMGESTNQRGKQGKNSYLGGDYTPTPFTFYMSDIQYSYNTIFVSLFIVCVLFDLNTSQIFFDIKIIESVY